MIKDEQRYIWIDLMKIIGLYFIILGHFFPTYKSYIYAFNVPLFFIVSGFLTKKESDIKTFYYKNLLNLIIPVFLIININYIWDYSTHYGQITLWDYFIRIKNALIGMHGINNGGGLGTCWFVYTLIILKITNQIFNKKINLFLLILLPLAAILFYFKGIASGNAILNTTVAYPFWWIGILLQKKRKYLSQFSVTTKKNIAILYVSIITLYIVSNHNGTPYVYINGYGKYISLFIIGALAGTYIIMYTAKIMELYSWYNLQYIKLLSSGSIVILGLHTIGIDLFHYYGCNGQGITPIFYSFIILISFIPINILLKKFIPIIFGQRL